MAQEFWTNSVNRRLTAWTGKTMEAFPAYDFAAAQEEGIEPQDAAQEAIDIQAWTEEEAKKKRH